MQQYCSEIGHSAVNKEELWKKGIRDRIKKKQDPKFEDFHKKPQQIADLS